MRVRGKSVDSMISEFVEISIVERFDGGWFCPVTITHDSKFCVFLKPFDRDGDREV